MKKKFFAVALATTMALSSAMTASAATLSGAFWTAWTEGYEVKDGATIEFDMEVKGGTTVWNNYAAVFVNAKTTGTAAPKDEVGDSYKEYAVIRGDNWGWGGGDNKSVGGGDITYEGGIADLGDADFIATMADAHLDIKISKSGNDVTMVTEATGANGKTYTRTAKFSDDTSAGLYVFFTPDTAEITVTPVTAAADNGAAGETETKAPAAGETETKAPAATTPKTGDAAPVVALAAVAVLASATVVVSRKKVTE